MSNFHLAMHHRGAQAWPSYRRVTTARCDESPTRQRPLCSSGSKVTCTRSDDRGDQWMLMKFVHLADLRIGLILYYLEVVSRLLFSVIN